jgi:hypothetical protein
MEETLELLKNQSEEKGSINVDNFNPLQEGFKEARCSSLTNDEKESPNGTFFIHRTEAKEKFFVKKDEIWYSITSEVGIPA